jgi:hypothetical protein
VGAFATPFKKLRSSSGRREKRERRKIFDLLGHSLSL